MNAERFKSLAGAYGGDIRRWPADAREAAWAHLEAHDQARAVLIEAAALDALLNASPPPAAEDALREKILFAAPRARPVWTRPGAWMSGAGLAAACAAGVMMGASYAPILFEDPAAEALSYTASAFDDAGWFEGLEEDGV